MRVFLDANILFSAGKSGGAMRAFLVQLKSTGHVLIADAYVAGEAERNFEAKLPSAMRDFEELMKQVDVSPGASQPFSPEIAPELPEKDRPVLAAAIHHRCAILLTGDKTHFGPLYGRIVKGVEIHSPASLATMLQA